MKILKILLILLVPAIGIVGCRKSELKPKCDHDNRSSAPAANKPADSNVSNDANIGARGMAPTVGDDNNGSPIIGSGDDDRDGGDKKHKK
jgi:hypothetical protein